MRSGSRAARVEGLETDIALTKLDAVAFFAYVAFGADVCGATGSSCGGFARQGNVVVIVGGLAATVLFALALRRPGQLVIPEDDERALAVLIVLRRSPRQFA